MSDDVEQFRSAPFDCPKCGGESVIDRFIEGNPVQDSSGEYRFTVMPSAAQYLVVHCRVCSYERLMQPADSESVPRGQDSATTED